VRKRVLPKVLGEPRRLSRMRGFLLFLSLSLGWLAPVSAFERTVREYKLPPVALQRADGRPMQISDALADGRPVVLTFMYTSCQTVCPITNQVLLEAERLLGEQAAKVNLVSISIDPDHDTVQKLSAYARKSGNRGSFFTGDPGASESVQRAFEAWRGDKMNHEGVFLLNAGQRGDGSWTRLNGWVTPAQLIHELQVLAPALRATSIAAPAAAPATKHRFPPAPSSQ